MSHRRRTETPSGKAAARPRSPAFSEGDTRVADERAEEPITLDVVDGEGRVIGALTLEPLE